MNFRLLIVPPAWQRIQAVSSLGKLGQLGTPVARCVADLRAGEWHTCPPLGDREADRQRQEDIRPCRKAILGFLAQLPCPSTAGIIPSWPQLTIYTFKPLRPSVRAPVCVNAITLGGGWLRAAWISDDCVERFAGALAPAIGRFSPRTVFSRSGVFFPCC